MAELQRCRKCLLPQTYETIEFDAEGVCNICRGREFRDQKVDWDERRRQLDALVESHRGKHRYDCIVPYSGGKDTTFTLWFLVTTYKLKPLVVQFDHGFQRDRVKENNLRTLRKLGVDVHTFTPNWRLVRRLMLEAFRRKGDFCWHCHAGIFSYPMHVAIAQQVPLVLWGEPSAEYTQYYDYRDGEIEEVDETRFNRFTNIGITAQDMLGMIRGDFEVDARDMLPFTYPPLADLKRLRYRSVCLGSYIPWDTRRQYGIIKKELGWTGDEVEGMPWQEWPFEKIECHMQGMRDYIKYLKRGYGRVSQMAALDLRSGTMTPEKARGLIAEYEGRKPHSLELFLEYVGLTEPEFNDIVRQTVVPPHQPDFSVVRWADKPWDFERWRRR